MSTISQMSRNEQIVREAYRLGEGDVLDGIGFRNLFANDGTFNDMATLQSVQREQIPDVIAALGQTFPDIHRELLEVHAIGVVVAVELRIQGTHKGPFQTSQGMIDGTGARVDVPVADLWYLRDGYITRFNCYNQGFRGPQGIPGT